MGVVRREGPWRLEKQDEGVYEITYNREVQEIVLVAEAADRETSSRFGIGQQVHRVDSFAEAEGLIRRTRPR